MQQQTVDDARMHGGRFVAADGHPGRLVERQHRVRHDALGESAPSPALCVAVDDANWPAGWCGRQDQGVAHGPRGRGASPPVFKEALAWQAFTRTPVLSLVVTVKSLCRGRKGNYK